MAKLKILTAGDPVLRQTAAEVTKIDKKLIKLLKDMAETMYAADGVGLAAPQIGVSKRIVVIDVGDGLIEMINPVIVKKEGSVVGGEGCLSVPEYEGEVERAEKVECEFTDRSGKRYLIEKISDVSLILQWDISDICNSSYFDHLYLPFLKAVFPV